MSKSPKERSATHRQNVVAGSSCAQPAHSQTGTKSPASCSTTAGGANGLSGEHELTSEHSVPDDKTPPIADVDQQVPPIYSTFSHWGKRAIVTGAAVAALLSPLTGQIYLPALNLISQDFHITASQVNLTVTTYMIFQGITPMFVGAFADSVGRRPAYVICFVVYILANIGLAVSRNFESLLIVRMLQSAGSSSTVALCQAVMADIVTSAERGQYVALTVIPVMLGPSLGPVLGGILSQYLGWRAIFWFLAIFATVIFALMLLFLPETCRVIVGNGSIRPHPFHQTIWQLLKDWRRKHAANKPGDANNLQRTPSGSSAAGRPLKIQMPNLLGSLILLFQKEIGLLLLYSSIIFSGFYAVATPVPSILATNYGFDELTIGLIYLPLAGGSVFNALFMGKAINWNYCRQARKLGILVDRSRQQDLSNFPIEKARLEIGIPLLILSVIATLAWGWALQAQVHIAVPCVLLFLMGIGLTGFQNTANVLLVDVSSGRVGAAVAANNLSRCLLGAAFTALIDPIIKGIGLGWAYVLVGLLYVAFSPILFLIMRRGIDWRRQLREKDDITHRRKEEKNKRKGLHEHNGDVDRETADLQTKEAESGRADART